MRWLTHMNAPHGTAITTAICNKRRQPLRYGQPVTCVAAKLCRPAAMLQQWSRTLVDTTITNISPRPPLNRSEPSFKCCPACLLIHQPSNQHCHGAWSESASFATLSLLCCPIGDLTSHPCTPLATPLPHSQLPNFNAYASPAVPLPQCMA